jgi:stage II sporulation protein AB (anti-sigma F factor)
MRNTAKTLSLTLTAEPESVPKARRALDDFAVAAGATGRQIDGVRLACSEAVTNAVLHAYREQPGDVYVTAAVASGELWILIADDGCGLEPRADRPGLGLGLGLISQVVDFLAVVPRAGGGTEVRIRFDLQTDGVRRRYASPDTESRASGPENQRSRAPLGRLGV